MSRAQDAPRIINWSPGLRTALSEIEVDYKDVDGELVYISYPLVDGSGLLYRQQATSSTEWQMRMPRYSLRGSRSLVC